jgi:glycosyltransferase involved in cell wall biosynthesis
MSATDFTVCIPWRPSPSRLTPFECVLRYWDEFFPGVRVVTADSDPDYIFNLGQARNNAVRQAETRVVMVADADTVILPAENVKKAIADPVGVTWPHKHWALIPPDYADKPFEEFPSAPRLMEYPEGLGGCIVATTEEWWRLGGQPEEFVDGWGCEDKAFHIVAMTLSKHRRIGGTAYSIEHNVDLRQADSPGWNRDSRRNLPKFAPYENANGKPWLMRELLKIRDEPLPDGRADWRTRLGVYDPVRRELYGTKKPVEVPVNDWRSRWIKT